MITIGVMAKAPVAGHCKTRLAAALGDARAAALCEAMLRDTLDAIVANVPADRFVVLAAPEHDGAKLLAAIAPRPWEIIAQEGADLGARLAHATATLGERGPVALVDADSPTADWRAAGEALARLAPGRAILGPCADGGYWLIALAAPATRVFDEITWSTPVVAAETRARCGEIGLALEELPLAFDVDERKDLDRLRSELRDRPALAPRTAAVLERG
jgi:hypothetical protein